MKSIAIAEFAKLRHTEEAEFAKSSGSLGAEMPPVDIRTHQTKIAMLFISLNCERLAEAETASTKMTCMNAEKHVVELVSAHLQARVSKRDQRRAAQKHIRKSNWYIYS
jgi:hypothetical protein